MTWQSDRLLGLRSSAVDSTYDGASQVLALLLFLWGGRNKEDKRATTFSKVEDTSWKRKWRLSTSCRMPKNTQNTHKLSFIVLVLDMWGLPSGAAETKFFLKKEMDFVRSCLNFLLWNILLPLFNNKLTLPVMSCIENTMMSSPSMTRKIYFFFCFVAYCEKKCKKNGIEFKSRSFLLLTDLSTRKGKSGNKMKLKSLARASIMSYYMTSTDISAV